VQNVESRCNQLGNPHHHSSSAITQLTRQRNGSSLALGEIAALSDGHQLRTSLPHH